MTELGNVIVVTLAKVILTVCLLVSGWLIYESDWENSKTIVWILNGLLLCICLFIWILN